MRKHSVRIAIGVSAILTLALAAYGAAQSVSDRPPSQVIIPASFQPSTGGADVRASQTNDIGGADNPAAHHLIGPDNHAADDHGARVVPGTSGNVVPGTSGNGAALDIGKRPGSSTATTGSQVTTSTSGRGVNGSTRNGSSGRGNDGSGHH